MAHQLVMMLALKLGRQWEYSLVMLMELRWEVELEMMLATLLVKYLGLQWVALLEPL